MFNIAVDNKSVSSCGTAQFGKSYAEVQWFETVTVVPPSRPIASSVSYVARFICQVICCYRVQHADILAINASLKTD